MNFDKSLWSHKSDEWGTPFDLFRELNDEFHFRLDACTTGDNPLGTELFYTREHDGLKQKWVDPTFVNPPYGKGLQAIKWIEKALLEAETGVTTVMLLPSRTDTKWFHKYIYDKDGIELRFLKGRLTFRLPKDNPGLYYNDPNIPGNRTTNKTSAAPFPSVLIIFKPKDVRPV